MMRLAYDPASRRNVVEGRELHCGDFIDVLIDGQWVEGRYEATWSGGGAPKASFYFAGGVRPLVVGAVCRLGRS